MKIRKALLMSKWNIFRVNLLLMIKYKILGNYPKFRGCQYVMDGDFMCELWDNM